MMQTTTLPAFAATAGHDEREPEWLRQRRDEALARATLLGLPSAKHDDWKHTDLSAFSNGLQPTAPGGGRVELDATLLKPWRLKDTVRIVMVDGVLRNDLSDDVPDGVRVATLAPHGDDEVLQYHLGASSPDAADPFAELNLALFQGGVLLDVAEGARPAPLHVLQVATNPADSVNFPRVLVHVQARGEATVIEHHVSLEGADGTAIAATELHCHKEATLRHDLVQELGLQRHHLHTVHISQQRDAAVHQSNVSLGGAVVRCTIVATQRGEGASTTLSGLYLTAGAQRADFWTRVDHSAPHGSSEEHYRGVLAGQSRAAFTGNVLVRHGAQKTSARQQNRNLLLSREALVDTTPQLEILADDVQCSHGSTVGQLAPEQIFFLQSRGISHDDAVVMLTRAFAAEVVQQLSLPALRDHIDERITQWFEEVPT